MYTVSAFPSSVTGAVFKSIEAGLAACCVLARASATPISLVDVGLARAVAPPELCDPNVLAVRPEWLPGRGTRDSAAGPAMEPDQYEAALSRGAAAVAEAVAGGCEALALGEIGIGNTAAAAALLAALTGAKAEDVTGSGSGVDAEQRAQKVAVVRRASSRAWSSIVAVAEGLGHRGVLPRPAAPARGAGPNGATEPPVVLLSRGDAAELLLAEVGGFEIVALVGAMLEASRTKAIILVDGFICAVAALTAACVDPRAVHAMLLTHASPEPGFRLAAALLVRRGVPPPPIQAGMRLGEATGALLAIPLLRAAAAVLCEMGTLEETMAL